MVLGGKRKARGTDKPKQAKKNRRSYEGRTWLLIGLGLLTALVVAVVVLDEQFEVFSLSPRIPHDVAAPNRSRIVFTIYPEAARGYLAAQGSKTMPLIDRLGLLDWGIANVLPYEVAVFFATDENLEELGVSVFVNDRRLAPMLIRSVSQADMPSRFDFLDWKTKTLVSKGRGFLSMDASMPVLPEAASMVRKEWNRSSLMAAPPRLDNKHFVEACFDNRDGGSSAALLSILVAQGADPKPLTEPDFVRVLAAVAHIVLWADITPAGEMSARMEIKMREDTPEEFRKAFPDSFELVLHQIIGDLESGLEGKVVQEGSDFVAEYTVPDVNAWLNSAAPEEGAVAADEAVATESTQEAPAEEPAPEKSAEAPPAKPAKAKK